MGGRPSPAPEARQPRPKEIIKEGLSEYFIYTIEGTETIPNGWSKRLRASMPADVPFKIQYRYRPAEYGEQLVRMYLLTNDEESKLGTTPLPDGTVRVFRDNGRDGLSYLTAQTIKYVPIGDKIELNLGPDPRSDLRPRQAPRAARQLLAASSRHQHVSQSRRRQGSPRGELLRRRLGRPRTLRAARFATTPTSRSRSKSAAPIPATSIFRSQLEPSCTTIKPPEFITRTFPPAKPPTCSSKSCGTKAATRSRITSCWKQRR